MRRPHLVDVAVDATHAGTDVPLLGTAPPITGSPVAKTPGVGSIDVVLPALPPSGLAWKQDGSTKHRALLGSRNRKEAAEGAPDHCGVIDLHYLPRLLCWAAELLGTP